MEEEEEAEEPETTVDIDSAAVAPKKTKAEIAFHKRQEELRVASAPASLQLVKGEESGVNLKNRRVIDKAQTSHREKVMKFNEHMDTLTEYNDIPKISWIK